MKRFSLVSFFCAFVAMASAHAATVSDPALRSDLLTTTYSFDLGDIVDGSAAILDVRYGVWNSNGTNSPTPPQIVLGLTINGADAGPIDVNGSYFTSPSFLNIDIGAFLMDGLNELVFTKIADNTEFGAATFATGELTLDFEQATTVPVAPAGLLLLSGLGALAGARRGKRAS